MNTLAEHPIDPKTASAVFSFSERVTKTFPVRQTILFGSRARGDFQSDSDADVAVLLSGDSGQFMPTKLGMADIAFDVLLETGILISPLPIWEGEWADPDQSRFPHLLYSIKRDGIVIQAN